jgi:hypothetical protein
MKGGRGGRKEEGAREQGSKGARERGRLYGVHARTHPVRTGCVRARACARSAIARLRDGCAGRNSGRPQRPRPTAPGLPNRPAPYCASPSTTATPLLRSRVRGGRHMAPHAARRAAAPRRRAYVEGCEGGGEWRGGARRCRCCYDGGKGVNGGGDASQFGERGERE